MTKRPRTDNLVSEEERFLKGYCPTLGLRGEMTVLTYVAFGGLVNYVNRNWLEKPKPFKFKDGMTIADFNKQLLLKNPSRELAALEMELTHGQPRR